MILNNVSFGANVQPTAGQVAGGGTAQIDSELAARLAAPPKYSVNGETPVADKFEPKATEKKEGGIGGKLVGLAFLAGAVATGLAIARGRVDAIKNVDLSKAFSSLGNIADKAKYVVAKGGQSVLDGVAKAQTKIAEVAPKLEAQAKALLEKVKNIIPKKA